MKILGFLFNKIEFCVEGVVMIINLVRAKIDDLEKILELQRIAFQDLLIKYRDYETSPATETKENIENKLRQKFTYFYYIFLNDTIVGAVRVVDKKDGSRKRVAPIFILKEYRNKGIAQKVFSEIERIHGEYNWKLDTIFQEKGNCYLYEKLGYKRIGNLEKINDKMDIVYYIKD